MYDLREHGTRPVGYAGLDDARGEHAVDVDGVKAALKLLDDLGVCDAVNVHYRRPREALAAEGRVFDLERGIGDAPPHERGVGAQDLGEAVLAALEGFFYRGLADAALVLLGAYLKGHRLGGLVEHDRAAALRYVRHDVVEGRAQFCLSAVNGALHQPLRRGGCPAAQKIRQRAQNVLARVAAVYDAVEPAYEDVLLAY